MPLFSNNIRLILICISNKRCNNLDIINFKLRINLFFISSLFNPEKAFSSKLFLIIKSIVLKIFLEISSSLLFLFSD